MKAKSGARWVLSKLDVNLVYTSLSYITFSYCSRLALTGRVSLTSFISYLVKLMTLIVKVDIVIQSFDVVDLI